MGTRIHEELVNDDRPAILYRLSKAGQILKRKVYAMEKGGGGRAAALDTPSDRACGRWHSCSKTPGEVLVFNVHEATVWFPDAEHGEWDLMVEFNVASRDELAKELFAIAIRKWAAEEHLRKMREIDDEYQRRMEASDHICECVIEDRSKTWKTDARKAS